MNLRVSHDRFLRNRSSPKVSNFPSVACSRQLQR